MTATDITLVVGVVSGNIILIINAFYNARGRAVISAQADAAVQTAISATAHGAAAAQRVEDVVTARADSQDLKLDQIHEATNGGVQALRDKAVVANARIDALEALLKTALSDLKTERAK